LLWGDSYAMHLAQAISASPTSLPFVQMTQSNCGPILGVAAYGRTYNSAWGKECIEHNEKIMRWLETQDQIKFVIMSSPFRQLYPERPLTIFNGATVNPNNGLGVEQLVFTLERLQAMGK